MLSTMQVLVCAGKVRAASSRLQLMTEISFVLFQSIRRIGNIFMRTSLVRSPLARQHVCCEFEDILEPEKDSRQNWFLFSGLGSQCNLLPKELYSNEPFMESINSSRRILRGVGINVEELLHPNNKSIYTCIRSGMVSISVVQMALYEAVKEMLHSEPSGLIGHSAGEILCGYADGCLTAEQVILTSNAVGTALIATKQMSAGMAAVGLSWNTVQSICPPDIFLSCEHTANSVMVSGPSESLKSFGKQLKAHGVFFRNIETCGFAPHSPYMKEASQLLVEILQEVFPKKNLRSDKWLSTSALEQDWDSPDVKYTSAQYYANTLKNQVWFRQALIHIPKEAVVIEISPAAIFKGIVKETVPTANYFTPILIVSKGTQNPAVLATLSLE